MVSMGTELGGGALAWRQQQMWPVQGWRGVVGGAGCAWQRGPAWDVAGLGLHAGLSLQPQAHQPQEASGIPGAQDPHWALQATFLLPSRWACPRPASSQQGLGLLDSTHIGW